MNNSHYHCPRDCENPQPFIASDGKRYCGRCWFRQGELTEVFLCTPETCMEDSHASETDDLPAIRTANDWDKPHYATHASDARCQCEACKTVSHASSCAVHNEPALAGGPCDCGPAGKESEGSPGRDLCETSRSNCEPERGTSDPTPADIATAFNTIPPEQYMRPIPSDDLERLKTDAAIARIKNRIDSHLNAALCEMKPNHDDSISGFNDAWDIVRKVFEDAAPSRIRRSE